MLLCQLFLHWSLALLNSDVQFTKSVYFGPERRGEEGRGVEVMLIGVVVLTLFVSNNSQNFQARRHRKLFFSSFLLFIYFCSC